jgi:hypothetical protein
MKLMGLGLDWVGLGISGYWQFVAVFMFIYFTGAFYRTYRQEPFQILEQSILKSRFKCNVSKYICILNAFYLQY